MTSIPSLFQHYISNVAVTMVFGLGYYVFKGLKNSLNNQNEEVGKIKFNSINALDYYKNANSLKDYYELIKTDNVTEDPFLVLNDIVKKGLIPDIETYNVLLLNCFMNYNWGAARLLVFEIVDITSPVTPNNSTLNIIIKGLHMEYKSKLTEEKLDYKSKISCLKENFDNDLEKIISKLDELGVSIDVISMNTIIESLFDQNRLSEAWDMFVKLKNITKPNHFTYITLLNGIIHCQPDISHEWYLKIANLLDEIKYDEVVSYESIVNYLLNCNLKFNKLDRIQEIFTVSKVKGKITESIYSTMIKVYSKNYKLDKCFDIMKELKEKFKPTVDSYSSLLNAVVKCKKIEYIDNIIEEMRKNEVQLTEQIYHIIINGFKARKNYDRALGLFDDLLKNFKNFDLNIFNTIMDCFVESCKIEKMEELFNMLSTSERNYPKANIITYSIILKGYSKTGKMKEIIKLYEFLRESNENFDEVLYNSLFECFADNNEVENINKLYIDMRKKSFKIELIKYSMLIKLNSKINNYQICCEIYEDMIKENVVPTIEIFITLIDQYLKADLINDSVFIFKKIIEMKINPEKKLFNCLINTCMKKEKIREAFELTFLACKANYIFENEMYNRLVDNILNDKKYKTAEKFDLLNRLLKIIKYRGIKFSQSIIDRSDKFISQNKVFKLNIYSSNTLYSLNSSKQISDDFKEVNKSLKDGDVINNINQFSDIKEMKSKKKNKTQKTKIKLKKIKNDCPIYLENKDNRENKFCNEAYGSNNFFKNEKSLYEVKNEK